MQAKAELFLLMSTVTITYTTRTSYKPVLYYVFFPFYTHKTREKWKG